MKKKFNFNLSKEKINRLNDYKRKVVYWGGKETLLGITSREKNLLILNKSEF